MTALLPNRLRTLLVAGAILAQAVAPVLVGAAHASLIDVESLVCAPASELSPEDRATIDLLLGALEGDEDQTAEDDCPFCTFDSSAAFALHQGSLEQTIYQTVHTAPVFEVGLFHKPQGPPLGLRAPPLSHEA